MIKRFAAALLLLLASPSTLLGQAPERPEPIKDNSFLIEEAYNQDPGVVQHISTFARPVHGNSWAYTFTQEWPVHGMKHQLSATISVLQLADPVGSRRGAGDVALNYRYQLVGESGGAVAVAPRLSLLLPTGSSRDGRGAGGMGVQVNLPLSVAVGEQLVLHSNAGATYTPRARDADGNSAATTGVNLGQSVVWLVSPSFNVLVETVWASSQAVAGANRTASTRSFVVSPGVRWAYNLPRGLQVVPGVAVPMGVGPSAGERSVFLYLSFEHPF